MSKENQEFENSLILSDVYLNLAVVFRGNILTIKSLHKTLQQLAEEMGYKIVYHRVGSQKLFITTEPPKHLETEQK